MFLSTCLFALCFFDPLFFVSGANTYNRLQELYNEKTSWGKKFKFGENHTDKTTDRNRKCVSAAAKQIDN